MSLQHTAVRVYIAVTRAQAVWRSPAAVDRELAKRGPWPATPPRARGGVEVEVVEGGRVVRLVPPGAHGTLIALHGGCYLFGPSPQHWTFWRTLAVRSRRTVVAPLYRLGPQGTAAEAVPWVAGIAEAAAGPVALIGDSAGGGLALAAALVLRDRGFTPPVLLCAPWLDGSLEQPWRLENDPWLAVPGMRYAADLWRGDLPMDHPFVSPLGADLAGLGPIVAASGTRDLLHRDTLRLRERVPHGSPLRVLTGEGLLHNYPLLPIPEARPAIRAYVDALR